MNDRSWLTRDMAGSAVLTLGLAIRSAGGDRRAPVLHLLTTAGLYDT